MQLNSDMAFISYICQNKHRALSELFVGIFGNTDTYQRAHYLTQSTCDHHPRLIENRVLTESTYFWTE